MGKKIVIVGGVAGGATAAARLRRLDESAEIIVLERTGFVSYANCGLPYYVGALSPRRAPSRCKARRASEYASTSTCAY